MIDGRRGRARREGNNDDSTGSVLSRLDLGGRLVSVGVSANLITSLGIVLAAANAVAVGAGLLWVGVLLLIVGGLMDTLDGVVAKAAGTSSSRGAFFDSVSDRVADGFLFAGVAWYLIGRRHPELAMLPIAILAVGAVISYERAKAESLGFIAKGGLMERAERLIGLGLALLIHGLMVPILIVVLALSVLTACGRFLRVWRQASGLPVRVRRKLGPGRVESRWRTWRETGLATSAHHHPHYRKRSGTEPLATRVRGVLSSDRPGTPARARGVRPPRTRGDRYRASGGLRRRFESGR
jgi:CDP-diacylglycerol--glycerol-3-phosphate 3-phosphatidyltransferase